MEFRLRRKNTSQDESPRKKRKEERCFQINEKILCYEPDAKLERVLYDAKIRDVYEIIKRGKKCCEYLVHFQGWNSSWDRRVNEDFILKDTPENRKLQRDLAEKNQLQLGAYLYRKERKKRKRLNERKMLLCSTDGSESIKPEEQNDFENEYYSSSATESHDDDSRVFLHMGEVLKKHLEYDHQKVTKEKIYAKLPAKLPIITILENFVKSYAIKEVLAAPKEQIKPKRRSSILLGVKREHKIKTIDYELISNNIDLCKEVADGLRIYFNFILKDFLLYAEEKEEYERTMSEENLKNFKYNPGVQLLLDDFFNKPEPIVECQQQQQQQDIAESLCPSIASDKRISTRLRSHSLKTDDEDKLENLSSMASTNDSNDSFPIYEPYPKGIFSKQWKPLNSAITPAAYKIIEEAFNWRMVGDDSNPEPSMIFGIYHLSRLVVKLPEFLSATPMNEDKMSSLLKYLDAFVEFLEENAEIYGPEYFVEVKQEVPDVIVSQ